jgi:hypothetical protein
MKKTHNNNLALGALCCALLAASSCSVALAAGREAALSSSPSVAAATMPDATTLPGLQIGEGFGRLAGAFASALDRLRPRIIGARAFAFWAGIGTAPLLLLCGHVPAMVFVMDAPNVL